MKSEKVKKLKPKVGHGFLWVVGALTLFAWLFAHSWASARVLV